MWTQFSFKVRGMLISPVHIYQIQIRKGETDFGRKIQYELSYMKMKEILKFGGPGPQNIVGCLWRGKSRAFQGHLPRLGSCISLQGRSGNSPVKTGKPAAKGGGMADSDREAPSPEASQTHSGTKWGGSRFRARENRAWNSSLGSVPDQPLTLN